MRILATDLTRDVYEGIVKSIPSFYTSVYDVMEIQRANAEEITLNGDDMNDLFSQFFIESATWGLDLWEREYGIVKNATLNYDQRRASVFAKRRSTSVLTKQRLIEVANSFLGGTISVQEDIPNYRIGITFIDIFGVPSNISDFKTMIRNVVPAHLDIAYTYKYLLWSDVNTKNYTWSSISKTWDQIEGGNF